MASTVMQAGSMSSSTIQRSEKKSSSPPPSAEIFAKYAQAICQISSNEGKNLGSAFLHFFLLGIHRPS